MKRKWTLSRIYLLPLFVFLFALPGRSYAQCGTGTSLAGNLNPGTTWQTVSTISGQYFTFNATAGCTYTFSFCQNGGSYTSDPYLTITNNSNGYITANDDWCSLGSHLSWVCPTTGTYRIHHQDCCCGNYGYSRTLAYWSSCSSSNCSGTPTAGSITVTGGSTFCGSGLPSFSLSGNTNSGGISLQWQYSTNGGSTYNDYVGATSSTYTPSAAITTTTMVRCSVRCSNSGITSYAGPVTITINPVPNLNVSPSAGGFICSGSTTSTTLTASAATGSTYAWTPATSLSSTTSASVTASPGSSTAYTVTATLGTCSQSMAVPVTVTSGPTVTTTATPSPVCSGSSTQLATTQSPTGYYVYQIAPAVHTIPNPTTATGFGSLDDGYIGVTLPFNFSFYGTSYSTLYIATNGIVGFDLNSITAYTPSSIPTSGTPNAYIAPFWHDMNLGGGGTITYGVTGVAPFRKFIVSYNACADYSAGGFNTGQVVLHETRNYIDCIVQQTTGATAKVLGIENSNGTDGAYAPNKNNTSWTINSGSTEAYRFTPTLWNYSWTPVTNLSSTTIYNPVRSNLTSTTTFTVAVTDTVTTCTTNSTVAVTVNPLPTGSISTTPSAICDGQTATVTITGTAGSTAYYNAAGAQQLPLTLTGGTATTTTPVLSNTTIYTLDSVVSTQGCKVVPNSKDTVIVNQRPTAAMSGSTTICNGSTAFLMVNVGQGTPPWTITYTDGTNTYTNTSSNTSFAIPVTPSVTTTYNLTAMVDALCNSISTDLTGFATVTVNPRPTATLSVPAATICNGTVQNLTVTLTGTAPFSFDVYDGSSYMNYTNVTTNVVTIPLNISATTTYSITSLTDVNCVGFSSDYGAPVTVTVNPRPTSVIGGSDIICNGNPTSALTVYLSGTAPWNFNYFDGNSTVAVNNVMTSPHTLTISPSVTANYTVVSLTDANCSAIGSDMTGSGNIVVNYQPTILSQSGNVTTCAGNNAIFAVNATGTNLVYQWTENGNPVTNGGVYSGANSPTLSISDITGLGGNVYVLNISGICPPSISSTPVTLNENIQNQWSGTIDTKWSTPGNWSCGILPTAATDVTIMPSAPFQPQVDIPTAICKGLLIYPGSSVNIIGTNNALEVKTNIVNLGTFNAQNGKLIVSGNGPQNVPGVIYKALEVQGGSVKTFSGNAVVTNNLGLFSGYIQLGQNNLVLGQNATVSGGSAGSFVVTNGTGKVVGENMGAGANTGTVLFPVGSNSQSYTPVMISNTGMADDINVRVIDGVWEDYSGNVGIGNPLTTDAVNKTWLIHEAIPGGSNATITPQWNFMDHLTNFTPSNCAVSHYTGDEWEPGPLSAATGFSPYTQTLTGVTSFSPFGVSSAGPLGLQLLSFKGAILNADAKLNWVTTNEVNMSEYELQRSTDQGNSFNRIGTSKAIGNNKIGQNTYSYVDASVTSLGVDKVLYRLKMKDNTNKYSYSNIVALSIGNAELSGNIHLYPNPVTGSDLYVKMGDLKTEGMSVQVTDMSGRVISTTDYAAGSYNAEAVKVDVSKLAQGIYMLRILDANKNTVETLKFNRQQ